MAPRSPIPALLAVLLLGAPGGGEAGEAYADPVTGMAFVRIGPGSSVPAFDIGRTEVTVGQFRRFADATGYETGAERRGFVVDIDAAMGRAMRRDGISWRRPGFDQGDDHPVVWVDWNDAAAFARWLSERTGERFRLPKEAEWEFAARGGTEGPWAGTADPGAVGEVAWYGGNSGGVPHRVGTRRANGFGLHDMSGNVWEWCADAVAADGAPGDSPAGVGAPEPFRALRGGSWRTDRPVVTTTYRNGYRPGYAHGSIGFRLVREVPPLR